MYPTLIMLLSDSVEESQARVDALVVQLSASQPIAALYPALLEQVLVASDSSTVSSRTKSLRALSLIVAQDPELFVRVRPFPTCPSVYPHVLTVLHSRMTSNAVWRAECWTAHLPSETRRLSSWASTL